MLKTAVIPMAGYGTRLYPLTKAIPKAFLPVVGADGLARPAILHSVDEALSAGVERVIIVASPTHQAALYGYFREPTDSAIYERLKPAYRAEADRLYALGERVEVITQPEPLGFGHAVLCARKAVAGDAFLLMLGDHLFVGDGELSCAAQLGAAFERLQTPVMALQPIAIEHLHHNGVVGGTWVDDERTLRLTRMLEKPNPEQARPLRTERGYFAALGQYALQSDVFDLLAEQVEAGATVQGEYQMTTALDGLAQNGRLYGFITAGQTYDIGHPARLLKAIRAYAPPGLE